MIDANETKRIKARGLRWKKPIVKNLNLDTIIEELYDIYEQCMDIYWYTDTDDDTLINALNGDENEAHEFRMMFSVLCGDCEQMITDLKEEWVPKCFDHFFVAVGAKDEYGGLLGYDEYEQDYFGIPCEDAFVEDESQKVLEKIKKRDLIAAARQCFRIYQSYIGLRYRFDCLKSAIDILHDENTGYLQMVKEIEEVYEKANKESSGFQYPYCKEVQELEKLADNLPLEAWLQ